MPDDRVPPAVESYGYRVIGWITDAIKESDEFLCGQDGYSKCDESIRSIMGDRKSTRLNSSHVARSYAVFCLKKKKTGAIHSCGAHRTSCSPLAAALSLPSSSRAATTAWRRRFLRWSLCGIAPTKSSAHPSSP